MFNEDNVFCTDKLQSHDCTNIMFHDVARLLCSRGRASHDVSCAISLRDMQDLRCKSWFCFAERICPADRLTVLRPVTILVSLGSWYYSRFT